MVMKLNEIDVIKRYTTEIETPKFVSELINLAKKDPYESLEGTNLVRLHREVLEFQIENNGYYRNFMKRQGWDPNDLRTESDIEEIPYVPASIFKRYKNIEKKEESNIPEKLLCVPEDTVKPYQSSSTSGNPSIVYMSDLEYWLVGEVYNRCFEKGIPKEELKELEIISTIPSLEFMEGRFFKAVTEGLKRLVKTLYPLLIIDSEGVRLDKEKIKYLLDEAQNKHKLIGFGPSPGETYNIFREFSREGLKWELTNFYIISGGGGYGGQKGMLQYEPFTPWAVFNSVKKVIPKIELKNYLEIFGTTESTSAFWGHLSENSQFPALHIPNHIKVVIRNPKTGEPVEEGEIGNLQIVSPFSWSQAGRNSGLQDGDIFRLVSKDKCDECGHEGSVIEWVSRTETREGKRKKWDSGYWS